MIPFPDQSETFGPFLLGHPAVREIFMRHHADLLNPAFWQAHQQRIRAGQVPDVFPYERSRLLSEDAAAASVSHPCPA